MEKSLDGINNQMNKYRHIISTYFRALLVRFVTADSSIAVPDREERNTLRKLQNIQTGTYNLKKKLTSRKKIYENRKPFNK